MKQLSPFRAAIFDLDGTLIDSMDVWTAVDEEFLGRRGLALTPDYTAALNSMCFQEAAEYTIHRFGFRETPEELIAEWTSMVEDEYAHRITLKPFVREYLDFLTERGVKLGVATASAKELYGPVLKNNGVYDYFDGFASVREVSRGKGFPDVYLLAAERLGTDPADCIVFEDVLPGIRGAKAAGMKAVGIYEAHSQPDEEQIRAEADFYITSFDELLPEQK